jgi:hypothetical protein
MFLLLPKEATWPTLPRKESMSNYITCDGCGVVLDFNSYALTKEERFNHDGDKVCEHTQCPVCKTWTPSGEWEEKN